MREMTRLRLAIQNVGTRYRGEPGRQCSTTTAALMLGEAQCTLPQRARVKRVELWRPGRTSNFGRTLLCLRNSNARSGTPVCRYFIIHDAENHEFDDPAGGKPKG
jgi:hypothetical protein